MLTAMLYRYLWIRGRGNAITPTGFGVGLAPALLAAALVLGAPAGIVAAFMIAAVATTVYWLDDLFELSARMRLALSFATGVSVCTALLADVAMPLWLLAGSCLAAGILNVVLTNIVNFYDGADLNLATFIGLTAILVLMFGSDDHAMAGGAIACLSFIAPFAVMNSRPKTIYLGDAGSFAFAIFLTILAVRYLSGSKLSAEFAIPLALPALDTFYVFCIRIAERQDLMTRNYLHLYQKLNARYRGFGYLLPQIFNALLLLVGAALLRSWGVSPFFSVAIACVAVTVPFYFASRRNFVARPDPDGGKHD
jgi:UDP-N-acetylmuramyl pentapeptide phosphotransferase/UDP-N-acetylglucosamine-1-phosphate transferase